MLIDFSSYLLVELTEFQKIFQSQHCLKNTIKSNAFQNSLKYKVNAKKKVILLLIIELFSKKMFAITKSPACSFSFVFVFRKSLSFPIRSLI